MVKCLLTPSKPHQILPWMGLLEAAMGPMGRCQRRDRESYAFPSVALGLQDCGRLPSLEGAEDQSVSSRDAAVGG